MFGGPSAYLEKRRYIAKYVSALLMIAMILAFFLYLMANQQLSQDPVKAIALGLGMLFIYKYIDQLAWNYLYTAWNFKRGLDSEALVYEELKKLPDEYIVVQDVKIPNTKTNIDFVVFGPNGIFAIEVKSHKGAITYNGKQLLRNGYQLEKNFLWQVHAESRALTEYLQANVDRSLYANPILVFSNSKAIMKFGKIPVDGVVVIKIVWLIEQIAKNFTTMRISTEYIDQATKLLNPNQPHGALS